jgi:hypothetical protein
LELPQLCQSKKDVQSLDIEKSPIHFKIITNGGFGYTRTWRLPFNLPTLLRRLCARVISEEAEASGRKQTLRHY